MQMTIHPTRELSGPNRPHLMLLMMGLILISGCIQNQSTLTTNDLIGQWESVDDKIAYFTTENTVIVKKSTSPHTLLKGGWFVIHGQRLIIYELVDNKRHWLQVEYLQPGRFQIKNESALAGRWNKISTDFPRDLW